MGSASTHPAPRALQADGLSDPVGVRSPRPWLSWKLDGPVAPDHFRVLGASTLQRLVEGEGDVFDITVAGTTAEWPAAELQSRQRVWWAVSADDGPWSDPAFVEAPLWHPEEWQATPITHQEWLRPGAIAPAALPQLRTTFSIHSKVTSARLYLTGAGVVVPDLNGNRAIDAELEPGYSDLRVSTLATAWDVTDAIRDGVNSLELTLASGIAYLPSGKRYTKFERTGEPVWAQVRLEASHPDGTSTVVVTDDTWQARLGPVVTSHWYGGETFVDGHATPWEPAVLVKAVAPVRWRAAPPVRVVDVLRPQHIRHHKGHLVVDFGTNCAGRLRLQLSAARPTEPIVLTPSELLKDGFVDQSTTGSPIWDSFTPVSPRAEWTPIGVYHGARYWDVTGVSAEEAGQAIELEVLRADNQRVGEFSSSDQFLSRLHEIIDRAVQSNMFSVFTDCPHREKLGWLEQIHYCFSVLARGYDVHAHLGDIVRHMIEAQTPDGLIPNIAPELVVFNEYPVKGDIDAFRNDPNWGRAIIDVPWLLYRQYGDSRIIIEALPAITRYLAYLDTRATHHILDFGLGDWIEVDTTTPRDMVATHGWASMLDTAADSASAVGFDDLGKIWRARADKVWAAFRSRFWEPRTGVWGSGSQGSWALAWSSRHADSDATHAIARGLLDAISRAGDTLTVGEISLPHLIRALTEIGQADKLNRLIRHQNAPGYGHQIDEGASSLAESWQGTEGQTGVASQNHFMLGVIDDWLTGDVAGLRQAPGSVGWEKVVIRPYPLQGVDTVSTTFDSPQGRMTVAWERDQDGTVVVTVDLPAHVEREVILPPNAVLRR
ncbi:hypothetical protein GCM10027024_21320 [Microbacterium insulae]